MIDIANVKKQVDEIKLKGIGNPQGTIDRIYLLFESEMKKESWYKYLKTDEFTTSELMLQYECFEDDDDTIWRNNTPDGERETGTKDILALRSLIVMRD
ncbi:MAG: hypothetical protein IJ168_09040 [Eubacterium sp.]|nr:hypothetical protein [Eubacterium sp.]